jgi:hypothetical protein
MHDLTYLPALLVAALRDAGIDPVAADAQAQALYQYVWRDYERAGQPCGPGHAGLARWLMLQTPMDLTVRCA